MTSEIAYITIESILRARARNKIIDLLRDSAIVSVHIPLPIFPLQKNFKLKPSNQPMRSSAHQIFCCPLSLFLATLMLTNYTSNAQPAPTTTMPAVGEFEAPTNPGGVFQPSVGGPLRTSSLPLYLRHQRTLQHLVAFRPATLLQMSNFLLHPLVLILLLHLFATASMATMSEFQLVSQALNARSQGDVQTARLILPELRRRNPSNPQYERLLSKSNSAFAQPSPPPSFPTPVPGTTPSSTVQDLSWRKSTSSILPHPWRRSRRATRGSASPTLSLVKVLLP